MLASNRVNAVDGRRVVGGVDTDQVTLFDQISQFDSGSQGFLFGYLCGYKIEGGRCCRGGG